MGTQGWEDAEARPRVLQAFPVLTSTDLTLCILHCKNGTENFTVFMGLSSACGTECAERAGK